MSTAIEEWLTSLVRSNQRPHGLARTSVRHIYKVMKLIFKYAVKWGYLGRNPMADKLVELPRGSTRRMQPPVQLMPAGYMALLAELPLLGRLAVAVAGWLGPRRSEGFGLKWRDLDFLNRVVRFTQGVVEGRVSSLKTEASRQVQPLPDDVAGLLLIWRQVTPYCQPEDWVFASPYSRGQRPYWPGQLMKSHIRPVAERLGLGGSAGTASATAPTPGARRQDWRRRR
jgi:integrase